MKPSADLRVDEGPEILDFGGARGLRSSGFDGEKSRAKGQNTVVDGSEIPGPTSLDGAKARGK